MTEEEAKTKLCCEQLNNRDHPLCLGSACMAWRWNEFKIKVQTDSVIEAEDMTGYCGKAGAL